MKVSIVTHPTFLQSRSMPLFADMLSVEFGAVEVLRPKPFFYRLPAPKSFKKWLGYIDQLLIFPLILYIKSRLGRRDVLYVFTDQALGPWVPFIKKRPHVIHCHDLMALKSALGLVPENVTGLTGKIYQRLIRFGFSHGQHFICVSEKTKQDLYNFGRVSDRKVDVVYNGLNYPYRPLSLEKRTAVLSRSGCPAEPRGMILHVGGSQWYKNRAGVLLLYSAYVAATEDPLPLWMVGPKDTPDIAAALKAVPPRGRVHVLSDLDSETLEAAYSHALLLLFPSLDEGFGWPIIEAQACGTLVLTTNAPPMSEVGGAAAYYLPKRPPGAETLWSEEGAKQMRLILNQSDEARSKRVSQGLENASRFEATAILNQYRAIYHQAFSVAFKS